MKLCKFQSIFFTFILFQGLQLHEIDSELEKKVTQTPDKKIPYIAVRGAVKALGSPINSISAPQTTGVIQKISLKEHVITRSSAGFWYAFKETSNLFN